jgi:hypothetical protein
VYSYEIQKLAFFNLYQVPNLKIKIPAAIVSSATTKVCGDTNVLNMPGAVEMYWQSDSLLLQIFCTGKTTITKTSKIKINIPISEQTAPHFIILSTYLMAISNHEKLLKP